jgi:hypothetical protein
MPSIMRLSIRILAGLAIGIVVCFAAATLLAIALALVQTYFSGHGIQAPYLTREYTFGSSRATGADLIVVGGSAGLGILAMVIWFVATRERKADKAAFSGAGLITGADTPSKRGSSTGE